MKCLPRHGPSDCQQFVPVGTRTFKVYHIPYIVDSYKYSELFQPAAVSLFISLSYGFIGELTVY